MIRRATTASEHPQQPGAIARRKGTLICKSCGSCDLWRIDQRSGIVAAVMRFRGRKPFQCRACGWICYRPARRTQDDTPPFFSEKVFSEKVALNSTANLRTLSGALGSISEHCDDMKGVGAPANSAGAAGLKAEDQSIRAGRQLAARDPAEVAAGDPTAHKSRSRIGEQDDTC
jgi:hypothetical protein